MQKQKIGKSSFRMIFLLAISFIIALCVVFLGGLKEKESVNIIEIVLTMSVAMSGFGLVAFQVAHASNELKKDFIETSIIMILATLSGFFYLVYPERNLLEWINFGEISIFLFFWGFILLLIILIDRRFDFLK